MKNCIVLAGNYGSGKTELSLNLALKLAGEGRTVLCDMDIVNPYFRSSEHKSLLNRNGIDLIAPTFANTTVDVPAIGAEVKSAFLADNAVFDAGGDPVGAAAIGSIYENFGSDTEFWYVVNARRPLQRNADEIIKMMQQIAGRARLNLTGIVNNTNLARETTAEDLEYGLEVCSEITEKTGLKVVFSSGTKEIIKEFLLRKPDEKVFEIEVFTRPYWLDTTAE